MQSGNRIKDTRRKNKMTQKALAEKVEVAEITIRQYENGSRNPNPDMLCKIADALDVTTDYLLKRADEPNVKIATQEDIDNFSNSEFSYIDSDGCMVEYDPVSVLTKNLGRLNPDGQKKVIQYSSDLLKIPQYQKNPEYEKTLENEKSSLDEN